MVEFKDLANDAWTGMVQHTAPLNRHERAAQPFRSRRQGYGDDSGVGGGSSAGGGSSGSSRGGCAPGPPGVSFYSTSSSIMHMF